MPCHGIDRGSTPLIRSKKDTVTKLRNLINKEELKSLIQSDQTPRTTLSFYRYTKIADPQQLRDELFEQWSELGVLGRIYLAHEGINAQMSIPTENLQKFRDHLDATPLFAQVPFKIAVEDNGKSFYKLAIKVREKIVADGLNDDTFDTSNTGTHLNAEQFNQAIEQGAVVVDMRNHYESEVGHFENAICPDADTFREELQLVQELIKDKKDQKVLFYCTGGIRCEKASAYFKHLGYKDVNQLHGGIIEYAKEVAEKNLPSKFHGKNFVFDERIGERITSEIIAKCHQCGQPCDDHTNCANNACHLLFIQCKACQEKFANCCTEKCKQFIELPAEDQRRLRKNSTREDHLAVYKSRLRPKLSSSLAS
ncbi:rhodanese-related sulfurtransferase [Candidatus Gracilibacteria bacterium]|nr:rhodanese-related sulfurtransferase [Candidatus Gracilibacteria bacterium]